MSAPRPKPAHLTPAYGAQFEDRSMAAAYHARPPYPAEVFDVLEALQPAGARRAVLDLGCGTGDVTLGLVGRATLIDAVDPSAAMLAIGRGRGGADHPSLRWVCAAAEACELRGPYSLVVAGESLHWMEWDIVLPRIAGVLAPGAVLAVVVRQDADALPWAAGLAELIPRHTTNREFRRYDVIDEVASRGLFREVGRRSTAPVEFAQSTTTTSSHSTRETASRVSA
jgi:trans-aconitate methyltransferase